MQSTIKVSQTSTSTSQEQTELQMTDFRYSTGEELEQFLYEKCRQDPDLLATIISEYVCSLSDSKLDELEDFLSNNFGDD